jgi:dipeptidyl aminopeptidase/acylaminoacyl peptidase
MPRPWTAADLWKVARVGCPVPSRSGSFAVVGITRHDVPKNEGHEVLHLLREGGARALTAEVSSSSQPAISPDERTLAFVRKPAGEEHPQLHLLPLDGGEARKLTDLPLGVSCPLWLPDGARLIVLAQLHPERLTVEDTRRIRDERAKQKGRPHVTEDRLYRFWDAWIDEGKVWHLFVVDAATGEARDLTPESRRWFDLMDPEGQIDVSPDGAEVAFSASVADPPRGLVRFAIHVVDTAGGGAVRCLTADNPADDVRPRYTPDGRSIVFGTKRDLFNYADRVRLARLDRETLRQEVLTEGWELSADAFELAGAGTAVVQAERRGRVCLFRLDLAAGGAPALLTDDGSWHGPRVAGDGHVYGQRSTIASPPEVARVPLAGGPVAVLGHVNDELLATLEPGRLEEVELVGANGDPIQMWILYPPGYDGGRRPLLQVLHGGPYGAHHDGWHFRWCPQLFAAPGRVAAFVNFHGSAGFGQQAANSILADWGGKAAQDILLATDYLVEKGVADPERMAILGGSFGGYMAAWLSTQTDRFACAIAHACVYTLPSMMASDITQGVEKEIGGEPWSLPRDREAISRWDPSAWTLGYRTPTLVLHGEKDYRCPVEQGLALYGMLKAKGVPARLVVYPDEGHWILKPQASLHWYGEVNEWLDRWLR